MQSDKMDGEVDDDVLGYGDARSKLEVGLELRELQLQAYASLVDAVRATGRLDEAKKNFMMEVRKYFDISDQRHLMECKRAALDPHLTRIAECLTGVDFTGSWRLEGTRTFPEPPMFRRMCRNLKELCSNSVKIPLPLCNEPASTSVSDAEADEKIVENGPEKSQVPRTNTPPHPPLSVPGNISKPAEEVEMFKDDDSAIGMSMAFDVARAMEVTVEGDKKNTVLNDSPNLPSVQSKNTSDVKCEVIQDGEVISNDVEPTEVCTNSVSSNVEQDLKAKKEGISPFLVSLLQDRSNFKTLDPKMSLLSYIIKSRNHVDTVRCGDVNGEEFGLAEKQWLQLERRREQGVQTTPVSIVEESEEYTSSEDDDEIDCRDIKRERSPDITDTPTSTPIKQRLASVKSSTNSKKGRGAKRKLVKRPNKLEIPPTPVAKKVLKNAKQSKQVKHNKQLPKIKMFSKRPSYNEEEEEDVQMLSSEKSTAGVSRGRGLSKVRGRGAGRGRGLGRGRPPLGSNTPSQASATSLMDSSNLPPSPPYDPAAAMKSPSRSPHFPSPAKPAVHVHAPSTKPMKATKPKKSKPVSCSRRKSSLKAKDDDDMQVTWDDHDYEGAVLVRGNNLIPIRKRRSVSSNDTSTHSGDEHRRKERIYLNDSPDDQYWNRGIIKRRISTTTGDDEDPDSLPFNDEETDSASENETERGEHHSPPAHNNNSTSSPHHVRKSPSPPAQQHPTPAMQKQRLTSPVKVNSNSSGGSSQTQLPRITLPPPVFSTTLNETRSPKPVSVVDSLNLHLPITPTASSLAASAVVRRTPTIGGASSSTGGSGCGIFSNSQALIANSRGTPGILQKQRKAQPHILANSKAHQRTFIPTSNPSQNTDNFTGDTDFLILTLPNNL